MVTCSIKDIVEDVIANGELTKQDVEYIDGYIGYDVDIDVVVELLSIPQSLDEKNVHHDFRELLGRCLERLYAPDGVISDLLAKELVNLFDPEDILSSHEKAALRKLKRFKHGKVFQNFLDDRMV